MSLALAPLSLWCFGQVSVVGFAANLLAVPWVTLVVTPLALAGCLWSPLWTGAAEALSGLHTLLQWAAARPWALWSLPQAPWPLALAATVGGVVLVLRVPWMWRGVGLVLMGPALLWTPQRPLAGEFELIAADVGQGSGVLIRTANTSVLYDSGPLWSAENDAGQRVLVPLLRALGASPSTLVLSHSDSDHVGGAAAVLAALPPTTQVRASFAPGALPSLKHHTSAHWTRCEAGQQWVEDGVRFEVLHPSAALYEGEAQTLKPLSTNDLSCVLWVQGRHASALLTGDMGTRFEAELVRHHPELRATVLMAPHHGSHTSSSEALLNTVRPALIVVQAGHRNRYGHPAAQVTARYDRLGLPWTATPTCGALRWDSLTQTPTCHRDTHRRHWHWQAD
jgi:competence protein ComEC